MISSYHAITRNIGVFILKVKLKAYPNVSDTLFEMYIILMW